MSVNSEVETVSNIDDTLAARGQHYGDFKKTFAVIQEIKLAMQAGDGWDHMPLERREALEMIAVKIGRLVNGDSGHADSWHDIAGYARLVEDSLSCVAKIEVEVKTEDYVRWLAGALYEDAQNGGPLSGLCACKGGGVLELPESQLLSGTQISEIIDQGLSARKEPGQG